MPIPVSRTAKWIAVPIARVEPLGAHRDHDLAAFGELHRVVQQVDEDLPQPGDVADERPRRVRVQVVRDVEALLQRAGGHELERRLDALAEVERGAVQVEPAGLDLREVEDVVDDAEERVAAVPGHLRIVALLGSELRVQQEPGHPDHRVERRPDLVAHGGQERALRLGCGLGVPSRLLELADVVVKAVEADRLARDDYGGAEHLHVDEGSVLVRSPGDRVHEFPAHPPLRLRLGLDSDLVVGGHQVVDVAADGLLGRVAEEALGGRVPGGDGPIGGHEGDRDWAELDQCLVVPLLTLDLGDVVVDDHVADALLAHDDRRGEHLDVHE